MGWPSEADFVPSSPPAPPLPPRDSSSSPPPAYSPWETPGPSRGSAMLSPQQQPQPQPQSQQQKQHYALHSGDPRTSSTHSLAPSLHDDEGRRTLLVVYIHGFMGDTSSFRSFPAHVHNYLKEALAESHVIHSKVYPRYKTYKAITVARDNFSKWLEPHESDTTDTILIGHSMGGLLAADVALMPSTNAAYGHPLKHRILGTISLDAPLLGLHPGIIKSGIASLFRKAPDPPGKEQELSGSLSSQNASGLSIDDRMSFSTEGAMSSGMTSPVPLASTSSNASGISQPDPTFNPPFFNDVQFVDRGFWRNMAHFAKKHHSEGLFTSGYQHILSHLEFGACLADYPAMNARYNKIRRLEDVDELKAGAGPSGRREARVRYVNYYTVSTGIPKEPPPLPKRADTHLRPEPPGSSQAATATSSQASTPRISIEDYSDGEEMHDAMQFLEPVPEPDSEPERAMGLPPSKNESSKRESSGPSDGGQVPNMEGIGSREGSRGDAGTANVSEGAEGVEAEDPNDPNNDLPSIPSPPEPPPAPDLDRYTDKDARKQAEKEYKRVQKTYDQAVKNREKALRERQKLVDKRRKKAQKEAEKRQKEEDKRLAKEEKQQREATEEAKQQMPGPAGDEEEADQAAAASRAPQVVTPAQAQDLERRLTDLAFHDAPGRSQDRGPSSPPPLSPETTRASDHSSSAAATDIARRQKDKKGPVAAASAGGKKKEKEKLRKFCMLPPKSKDGMRDAAWVQVYMAGVDEVGAHCGLFFAGPHYETLVGDVGARIVSWVQEDMSKRAIMALG